MRVFSLSTGERDMLGFDDGGTMIDLTRALTLYDMTKGNYAGEPAVDIDSLILDERISMDCIGEVMEFCERRGLKNDLILKKGYTINAPLYPGKIIALGNNYREHIKEMNQQMPAEPVLFGKWPSTVIGPHESIRKPAWIGRMDYEAELAFVIGRNAHNVQATDAMSYVAGYTCLNDVTARDIQKKDIENRLPWMKSKNFDTFTPIGPCLLLAGAIGEPVEIDVQSRVNGELKQNGNTSDFIFDIPTTIEYITKIMALEPGDIVTTGTPVGVGALEPGDTVEIICSGVGTLSNPVVAIDYGSDQDTLGGSHG